jgi:hypothetical protein
VDGLREEMATKSDVADVRSKVHSLRADVASDLKNLEERIDERLKAQEKRLSDQISGLRRSVMEYHSSQSGMACCWPNSKSACAASKSTSASRPRGIEARVSSLLFPISSV